jgi:hypothetical protein
MVDYQTIIEGGTFEDNVSEYFKCVPLFTYKGGGFKRVDVDSFMNDLVKSLNIKNVFNPSVLLMDKIKDYSDVLDSFGHLGGSINVDVTKKLDEDGLDKGKNKILDKVIKGGDISEEKLDTIRMAIENAKYILDRTLLLSLYTGFKYDNIDDIFEYIKTKDRLIDIYLESIMIDGVDIDIIKFVYDNCFDKKMINDKLIFINKIFRDLINENDKMKKVTNIKKIVDLINSYFHYI